jgi:hypothetical protein
VQQHQRPSIHGRSLRDRLTGGSVHNFARLDCSAQEEADAKGIPPLSRERIKEFSAFSDEISDEEFDEYMAFINAERGRTP